MPRSSKAVVYKDSPLTSQKKTVSIGNNIRTCIICKICFVNNATRIENFNMETYQLVSFALLNCMWLSKMLLLRYYVASNIQIT